MTISRRSVLAAISVAAATGFILTGCTTNEGEKHADTAVAVDKIDFVGEWESSSTPSVTLQAFDDGRYVISPDCQSNGEWEFRDGQAQVKPTAALDMGECPDTFSVQGELINRFELNEGQLVVSDSNAAKETFEKVNS